MAPGTLWRLALRRHDRRVAAYHADPTPERFALLVEAAHLSNRLHAWAYGHGAMSRPGEKEATR